MKFGFVTTAVLAAISVAAGTGSASAQSTYVAGGTATAEGTGSTSIPMGNGGATNVTSQFLFSASQLGGLPTGSIITALGFRVNWNSPAQSTVLNFSNYEISLGGSTQPVGSLSTTFAANQAAGTAVVRTGALSVAANSFTSAPFSTGPQIPNPFYSITFTTPYTYTGGDLLLSLSYVTTGTRPTLSLDGTSYVAGGGLDSVSNISPTGTLAQFYSIPVVQFTTQAATAGVPEPATWAMMMMGFGAMGAAMRRRTKVAARVRFA